MASDILSDFSGEEDFSSASFSKTAVAGTETGSGTAGTETGTAGSETGTSTLVFGDFLDLKANCIFFVTACTSLSERSGNSSSSSPAGSSDFNGFCSSSDGFNGSVVAAPNCGFNGLGGVCGLGGVTGFVPIGGGNGLPFMVSLGGEIFFPFSVLFTL